MDKKIDLGLVGPDGQELKSVTTVTIPIVKFREYKFAMQLLQDEEVASDKSGGYRPGDLVREYRARCKELDDRVQLLTAILSVTIDQGFEAGKEFIDEIGLRVSDFEGKTLYDPEADRT